MPIKVRINLLTFHEFSLQALVLLTFFPLIAVTKKIKLRSSKGDVFLHESQHYINLPTIIWVTNKLSLILVSDANQ